MKQSLNSLETDVAVIGVGAMGSAALWQLAQRGVACAGFERFEPGHDRGSSHGESRIFRTAYLEGPGYVPLARRAVELWKQLRDESGVDLITANGALMLGPEGNSVITGAMRSITAHNLPHELLDADELRARYPAHQVSPGEVGIREDEGGFVRPELAVRTMAGRAQALGARLFSDVTIDRIELLPSGVRVSAGSAAGGGESIVCEARHAIISAGAWLPKLLPDLRLPVKVTRQLPGWYPIERPEWFAPDRFPVFIRDIGDHSRPGDIVATDSSFYGFPTLDGQTIKVAIHREGAIADPDRLDRHVAIEELAQVQEFITLFLRGVGTQPVRTQVCMYSNTPDHDFLVGSPNGLSQITILGGFSGHGFKFAPVMGEVAADLATRGETQYPIDFLTPRRFASTPTA